MTPLLAMPAAFSGCLFFACSVAPSRAPLGGDYTLPTSAPINDRRAEPEASTQADAAAPESMAEMAVASATPAAMAPAAAPSVPVDAIHFVPFQVGSRIEAKVTVSASAEMHGGPPSMSNQAKLALDSRLRVELEVRKTSAQSLEEMIVTLSTLSMHSEFGGRNVDSKPKPPESYDISLSGAAPTIRPRNGSKLDPEERVKLALFIVPLVEFYAHWARSPMLELKPGWTSKVSLPFAATLFPTASNETLRVGPLNTGFTGRVPASEDVPFELTLPVEYGSSLGRLAFDLSGSAKLNANSGRPTAFDMSGPLSAAGGPRDARLSITGTAKLSGTLSYP
ncbi:MAG TPA: hypothetical protein VJV79_16155 [Polyangiaceae bacterium]|nr:hypothetical protein [Polyangiaceae bacterium]